MTGHRGVEGPAFRQAWWLPGGHLQTMGGKYLRPAPALSLRRERWETPDQDFLDLDFGPEPDPLAPLILVLHGLEGFSRRPYVLYAVEVLRASGLASVALNFRGCSGEPNRLPRLYHSGETGDTAFVLSRLRERWPHRTLGALGYSLGGNVLLKLLGEDGPDLLDAAAAVSVPYDLQAGVEFLEGSRLGGIYTDYFLKSLKRKVEAKRRLLDPILDLERVMATETLRDFDDLATAPLHGFQDAADYYTRSSSKAFLSRVRTPTLLIHARNDPFLPEHAIPVDAMRANPALTPLISSGGGHVGFVAGPVPGRPRFWAEDQVRRFFMEHLRQAPGEPESGLPGPEPSL